MKNTGAIISFFSADTSFSFTEPLRSIYNVLPNYTLLKIEEDLDKKRKGSAVSQALGKAFDTICLHLLLQKQKKYKVLRSLLEVNPVYVYW